MKMIVSRCRDFITNFDKEFANLFITGNTGVGKSFLTHCIANELLKASRSVLYMTAFDLIEAFEAIPSEIQRTAKRIFMRTPCLIPS